jgi:hypothetical protein
MAQRAILFDGKFQIGDPAAAVRLIADDDESVALDSFNLEPILAATRALRQVDAL